MVLRVPAPGKVRHDKDTLQIYFQQTWNQCFRHHGEEPETEQPGWQAFIILGKGWFHGFPAFAERKRKGNRLIDVSLGHLLNEIILFNFHAPYQA